MWTSERWQFSEPFVFTMGACWVLALELARQDPSWRVAVTANEDHAFVVRNGWGIDLFGMAPLAVLLKRCSLYFDEEEEDTLGRTFDTPHEAEVYFTDTDTSWDTGCDPCWDLATRVAADLLIRAGFELEKAGVNGSRR